MDDVRNYRAALIEWYQEGYGQERLVVIGENVSDLLEKTGERIIQYTNLLCEKHKAPINSADIGGVYIKFGEFDYSINEADHEDLRSLLKTLINRKREELESGFEQETICGDWYELVEWINRTVPERDFCILPIEDTIPGFVKRLYEDELNQLLYYRLNSSKLQDDEDKDSDKYKRIYYDEIAKWAGWMATLMVKDPWNEGNQKESYQFLLTLIDEFNERYQFSE